MRGPVTRALTDPWGALRHVVDDPLHPGGTAATEDLLDRADVSAGTRLLDVGCGAGEAVSLARERGARAAGLDREPAGDVDGVVRGDLTAVPVRDGALDVVTAECVLCLSPDLARSLAEARRTLRPGGRLALSDVTVAGEPPELPPALAEPLCLTGGRDRPGLVAAVEAAGFDVRDTRDHRAELLAMRDQLRDRVDYERLLGAMGEEGQRLLAGVEALETAVAEGRVGYTSLVATA